MNIHFGKPNKINTIREAVPLYSSNEFDSATRSTIPMLTLLGHFPDLFNKIVREIEFPTNYDMFLEYTVGPFKGRGKPSHTDVMLKSGKDSMAIEVKWTEQIYPDVKDWPKKGATKTQNQKAVLEGWLDALSKRLAKSLDLSHFDNVVYQMIHRAASAAFAGERPRMAYFIFKPSPTSRAAKSEDVFEKLSNFWSLLGKPTIFPFWLVEIEMKTLESYEPLRSLKKGDEGTSEEVCAALQDTTPLFDFSGYRFCQVGQGAWQSRTNT